MKNNSLNNKMFSSLDREEMHKIVGGKKETYLTGYYLADYDGKDCPAGCTCYYKISQYEVWDCNIFGKPTKCLEKYELKDGVEVIKNNS